MPGSPDTRPAPELPEERRLALVIATQSYEDLSLRRLRSPGRDAEDLRGLLADPEIGGFAVTSVIDGTSQAVRIAVGDFLADRQPSDLVLVYLSCHGLVDLRRRLYFAARDTTKERLAATGVEAQWLLDQLEDCRARRQVLVLDCCFSGAFAVGSKGDQELGLGERFLGQGRGRVVLTASRGSEYSFEGELVAGQEVPGSVFTHALVDGIRSGNADLDRDGYISVDDAYGYAFDLVQSSGAQQTPQRWLYGAEGTILLARNPAGVTITPAELPQGITSALDSSYLSVRLGAVDALAEWLADEDPARALAARQALTEVVDNDRPEVAARAREHLATQAGRIRASSRSDTSSQWVGLPAEESTVVAGGGLWRRAWLPSSRRGWMITATVVVMVAALAGVLRGVWRSGENGGGLAGGARQGTYQASGPWRFEIHDRISGNDNGCNVDLGLDGSDRTWQWNDLYGVNAFQIPEEGTFRWSVNDSGCEIVTRATPGSATLPATFPAYQGDSDAFEVSGQFTVEVRQWERADSCELTLRDPSETRPSTSVDIQTARTDQPTVVLDPAGLSLVYLQDLSCEVRVTK